MSRTKRLTVIGVLLLGAMSVLYPQHQSPVTNPESQVLLRRNRPHGLQHPNRQRRARQKDRR